MINLDDHDVVVCRPALLKDTEDMLELCSHIWEGGDYIPSVWDDWLRDPQGLLGVAEMGGRVVGIFKLTKFQEGEWYMEGLRVHPDVQGKGIAAHIHKYVMDTWQKMGSGMIRLVTGSYNIKIHHMCEQSGFKRIAEFAPYRVPVLMEDIENFTPLNVDEASKAMQFVLGNAVHALSSGLINLGWVYGNLQLKHFQEAIHAGHAWWWKGGQGFLSTWEDDEDDRKEPGIQLLACPVDDLAEILMDYRRLMGKMGYQTANWVAPKREEVLSCLEMTGFQKSWDGSLYIYELRDMPFRGVE
jgi:GNAT superfamily N-acetyltransferase